MTKINQIQKTPDTSESLKKTDYSAKISGTERKVPSISDLTTNVALTTIKNKIPDVMTQNDVISYYI